MRFSIRWMLSAVAYVAVAAGAIATGYNWLVDFIWAVSWLAICFAVVVAAVGERKKRALAVGFLVLSIAHIIGLYLMPHRMPSARVCSVAGYIVMSDGTIYVRDTPMAAGEMLGPVRAANAVGTLVLGVVGCIIGRIAYRQSAKPHPSD